MIAWNRDEALALIRKAYTYLDSHYVEGQEWPEEESEEEQAITHAFKEEDMQALKAALREWAKACIRYALKAKESAA